MSELAVGKVIRMPCMRRGLVSYPNEMVLVTQESLEALAKTAHGIPMVIDHPHIPLNDSSIADIKVHGRVSKFEHDPATDLWMAEFVVDTQEAVNCLKSGWGVSTAWYGQDYNGSGTYNNIPYDRELVSGRYEHLAIVKNPRYEMARDPVFLNSATCQSNKVSVNINTNNPKKGKFMFNIFRTKREEIKQNEGDDYMVNVEGEDVKLADMVEAYKVGKAKEADAAMVKEEPAKKMLTHEDEVDVDGEKVKVAALIEAHKASKQMAEGEAKCAESEMKKEPKEAEKAPEMKKEEPKEAEAKEEKEPKEAESKEDKEEEGEDEEKKINSRFMALKHANSVENFDAQADSWLSTRDRVELGRSRYGSNK